MFNYCGSDIWNDTEEGAGNLRRVAIIKYLMTNKANKTQQPFFFIFDFSNK